MKQDERAKLLGTQDALWATSKDIAVLRDSFAYGTREHVDLERAHCLVLDTLGKVQARLGIVDESPGAPHEDDVCPDCGEAKLDGADFCDSCNAEGDATAAHYGVA